MRRPASLAAAALLLLSGRAAWAQNENCSLPGTIGLVDGTYDIPLKQFSTATYTEPKLHVNIEYSATIHLTVDKNGSTSAKGDATIEIHLNGQLGENGEAGGMNIDSSSSGPISTSSSSMKFFTMEGQLKGTGTQTGPLGGVSAAANGDEKLEFEILETSCEGASGTFKSKAFESTLSGFAAKGFVVTRGAGADWSFAESEDAKKDTQAVKDELQKIRGAAGSDAAADAGKLEHVLTTIKGKSDNVRKCLMKFWRETAMQVLAKDLAPKLAKLSSYPATGDVAGLDPLMDEALEVDKQYVRLGIDACTAGDRPEFQILAAKTGAMITRAIASGNTVQMLEFDKQWHLLTGVESGEGSRAWAAVQEIASKELKAAAKELKPLLKPLYVKKGPGIPCSDATVAAALRRAVAAEREVGLLTGNSADTMLLEARHFDAVCKK